MRVIIPAIWLAAVTLAGCSSSAPQAPIGLSKRPANSSQVLAGFTRAEAPPPVVSAAPSGQPQTPARVEIQVPVPHRKVTRIVVSDYSAPSGIQTLPASELTDLIRAARSAKVVHVFCRGDKVKPSSAQRAALLRKAAQVKAFLVAQGVDARRIRISVLSAGGFIADNSTKTGRAKNRRVEIHFG